MLDSLLLPEGARLIHIGPHKTGSTAIQVAMFEARSALAANGVYYPGESRRRREASEELLASAKGRDPGSPLEHWQALAQEVAAAGPMRVCVSDELFGKASAQTVARIVGDLGGASAHIVALARRYDSYLPSQWQERVKAGRGESYDEWLRIVLGDDARPWEYRNVWGAHDTKELVNRWVEHVGPERFTLIVADESDRAQLPRVFEAMLGLPEGLLQIDPSRSNQSFALAEVELIRAVNNVLADRGLSRSEYERLVKQGVRAIATYLGQTPGPRRPSMPKWADPMVRELSDARVEAINALPVRVVGDPEWLRTRPIEDADVDPSELRVPADLADRVAARVATALKANGTGSADLEKALQVSFPRRVDPLPS